MNHSKQNKSANAIDHAATPSNESPASSTSSPEEMLTVKEVAFALGFSRRKIYRMFSRGEIPSGRKVGRAILFCRETVVEWIQTYGKSARAPVWTSPLPREVECPFCSAALAPVVGEERNAFYRCAQQCCLWRGYSRRVDVDDNRVVMDVECASNVGVFPHLLVANDEGSCHVMIGSKFSTPEQLNLEGRHSLLEVVANLSRGSVS